jgi:hypothetical protein
MATRTRCPHGYVIYQEGGARACLKCDHPPVQIPKERYSIELNEGSFFYEADVVDHIGGVESWAFPDRGPRPTHKEVLRGFAEQIQKRGTIKNPDEARFLMEWAKEGLK